jgi:hypothetical protein
LSEQGEDATTIVEEIRVESLARRIAILRCLPRKLRYAVVFTFIAIACMVLTGPLIVAAVLLLKPKAKSICQKYNELTLEGRVVEKRQIFVKATDTKGERKIIFFL